MHIIDKQFAYFSKDDILINIEGFTDQEIDELVQRFGDRKNAEELLLQGFSSDIEKETALSSLLPISCGINITNACQLRCTYCSYSSGEAAEVTIRTKQLYRFIEFIFNNARVREKLNIRKKLPRFYFAGGGEPTYDWSLFVAAVEYIKELSQKHGIQYSLGLTSNFILNISQVDYIVGNFNDILVSYDGIHDVQNKNRSGCQFNDSASIVERNLSYLNSINKARFSIRTTIWPEDYVSLREMADNIYSNYHNVHSWAVEPVWELGRAKSNSIFTDSIHNILDVNFVEAYNSLKKYTMDKYHRIAYTSIFKNGCCTYNCGAILGQNPWLNADGKVFSCLDAINSSAYIAEVDDDEIHFYRYFDKLNSEHLHYVREICSKCIALPFCGGGCPLKHQRNADGERMNISSFWDCSQKQQYWEIALKTLINNGSYDNLCAKVIDTYKARNIYKIVGVPETNSIIDGGKQNANKVLY